MTKKLALGVALMLVSLCACGGRGLADVAPPAMSPSPPPFGQFYESVGGFAPMRPRTQVGDMGVVLNNHTVAPVTIEAVRWLGETDVARIHHLRLETGAEGFPGGGFIQEPPRIIQEHGVCLTAQLEPLAGYVLAPGATARVWTVIDWLRPGKLRVPGIAVDFSIDGVEGTQEIPVGYTGRVERGVAGPQIERSCLKRRTLLEGVRL